MKKGDKNPSFEEALKELEKIVEKLSGSLALEESVQLYERGMVLKGFCDKALKAAEDRINAIKVVRPREEGVEEVLVDASEGDDVIF